MMLFGLGLSCIKLAIAYWLGVIFDLEFKVLFWKQITLLLSARLVALYFKYLRQRLCTLVINPQALLNTLKLVENSLTRRLFRLVLLKHKT